MAGGQGFEPWFAGPEPAVLPLNDPPVLLNPKVIGSRFKGYRLLTSLTFTMLRLIFFTHWVKHNMRPYCSVILLLTVS